MVGVQEYSDGTVVQLGMTPRYLDTHCQEALYEVDVGINELQGRPDGAASSPEGMENRTLPASRPGA